MRKTSKGCNVDKWGIKQKAGIRPLSALRVNFVLKTHKKRQPLLFHWIPFFCEKSLIPPFATFWKPSPPPPPPPPPKDRRGATMDMSWCSLINASWITCWTPALLTRKLEQRSLRTLYCKYSYSFNEISIFLFSSLTVEICTFSVQIPTFQSERVQKSLPCIFVGQSDRQLECFHWP